MKEVMKSVAGMTVIGAMFIGLMVFAFWTYCGSPF